MTTSAEELFDEIAADLLENLDALGTVIDDQIKQDLDVPVQIVRGPRGGRKVIRSKPGEHPRRETGLLQSGVGHYVERNGVDVTLTVQDVVYYSRYLDPPLNRPILTAIDERFEDQFLDACVSAVQGSK